VDEQRATSQKISRNVQQAAQGVSEVASNVGNVTEAAKVTERLASSVLSAPAELSKNESTLASKVERFLSEIKAA